MASDAFDAIEIEEAAVVTVTELSARSGLTEFELRELVECGALRPSHGEGASFVFSRRSLTIARTARRLRDEYALDDVHSLAVLLRYVQRIEELEAELRRYRR
ncbi:MAG TPA: chaperone modulator CbpM [Casimicrobiaceae bacterium]